MTKTGLAILAVAVFCCAFYFFHRQRTDEVDVRSWFSGSGVPALEGARLTFASTVVGPALTPELEVASAAHYDFWCTNQNTVPVEFGPRYKSCTCTDVKGTSLSPEEAERYRLWALAGTACQAGQAARGVLPLVSQLAITERVTKRWSGIDLKWQTLLPTTVDHGTRVPPGHVGLVRLSLNSRRSHEQQEGTAALVIDIWTRATDEPASAMAFQRLEMPVRFYSPVRVSTAAVELGEIKAGEEKSVEFSCWSATRAAFGLRASPASNDPSLSCSCVPLTESEREQLARTRKTRVLAGYRVRVTAHEKALAGQGMDWGPFARKVLLATDSDIGEISVPVSGILRGPVALTSGGDHGTLVLGEFPYVSGKTENIRLLAEEPRLVVQVDRIEPAGSNPLKIKSIKKVESTGGAPAGQWDLAVEVPPRSCSGLLPEDCAIVLKISGESRRRLRIPVKGFGD